MIIRALAQRLSQRRDVARQVTFFDKLVGPDFPHHLFFVQRATAVPDEDQQDVEDFGCKRHDLAVAVEQTLDRVEAEGTELIELFDWLAHRLIPDCFPNFSGSMENARSSRSHSARRVQLEPICEAEFYPINCIHQALVRKHPYHAHHVNQGCVSPTATRPWRSHQYLESI